MKKIISHKYSSDKEIVFHENTYGGHTLKSFLFLRLFQHAKPLHFLLFAKISLGHLIQLAPKIGALTPIDRNYTSVPLFFQALTLCKQI
jgi:hypothetical protein